MYVYDTSFYFKIYFDVYVGSSGNLFLPPFLEEVSSFGAMPLSTNGLLNHTSKQIGMSIIYYINYLKLNNHL